MNDFVCTCGPHDHDAEELPQPAASRCCSRAASSRETGTAHRCCPKARCFWSRPGRCFVCSHRHGEGDRCLSFQFDAGAVRAHRPRCRRASRNSPATPCPRCAPLSPLTARARVAMQRSGRDGGDRDRARRHGRNRLAGKTHAQAAASPHHGPPERRAALHGGAQRAPHTITALAGWRSSARIISCAASRQRPASRRTNGSLRARLRDAAGRSACGHDQDAGDRPSRSMSASRTCRISPARSTRSSALARRVSACGVMDSGRPAVA